MEADVPEQLREHAGLMWQRWHRAAGGSTADRATGGSSASLLDTAHVGYAAPSHHTLDVMDFVQSVLVAQPSTGEWLRQSGGQRSLGQLDDTTPVEPVVAVSRTASAAVALASAKRGRERRRVKRASAIVDQLEREWAEGEDGAQGEGMSRAARPRVRIASESRSRSSGRERVAAKAAKAKKSKIKRKKLKRQKSSVQGF